MRSSRSKRSKLGVFQAKGSKVPPDETDFRQRASQDFSSARPSSPPTGHEAGSGEASHARGLQEYSPRPVASKFNARAQAQTPEGSPKEVIKMFGQAFSELSAEVGTAVGSAMGRVETFSGAFRTQMEAVSTLRPFDMLEDLLTPRQQNRHTEASAVMKSPPPSSGRKPISAAKTQPRAPKLQFDDWGWDATNEVSVKSDSPSFGASKHASLEQQEGIETVRNELKDAKAELGTLQAKCRKLEMEKKKLFAKLKAKDAGMLRCPLQELPRHESPERAANRRAEITYRETHAASLQDTCHFLESELQHAHQRQQSVQEENVKLRKDLWLLQSQNDLLLWRHGIIVCSSSEGADSPAKRAKTAVNPDVEYAKDVIAAFYPDLISQLPSKPHQEMEEDVPIKWKDPTLDSTTFV